MRLWCWSIELTVVERLHSTYQNIDWCRDVWRKVKVGASLKGYGLRWMLRCRTFILQLPWKLQRTRNSIASWKFSLSLDSPWLVPQIGHNVFQMQESRRTRLIQLAYGSEHVVLLDWPASGIYTPYLISKKKETGKAAPRREGVNPTVISFYQTWVSETQMMWLACPSWSTVPHVLDAYVLLSEGCYDICILCKFYGTKKYCKTYKKRW